MDAVQETFVVALTRLGSIHDPGAVGGWLRVVLRNCCLLQRRRVRHEVLGDRPEVRASAPGPEEVVDRLESARTGEWTAFYRRLHQLPEPRTYRGLYRDDVTVRDGTGRWHGIQDWSAEERAAIDLGVRGEVRGLAATADLTVLEIDFRNPPRAAGHCPPSSTFVHRLRGGRSASVDIYYHASS